MENNFKIGLVIMASGLGKRFGGNKLITNLGDKPLIKWILDVTADFFDKRIVVTRSSEIKELCDSYGIECIIHKLPNRNDTVRLGLTSLMNEIDYCFFVPADQPLLSETTVKKMIDEAKKYQDKIVRACYRETAGSPIGFPAVFFDELLNLPEGKGGNWLVNQKKEKVHLTEVDRECELYDVDTREDLEKIIALLEK